MELNCQYAAHQAVENTISESSTCSQSVEVSVSSLATTNLKVGVRSHTSYVQCRCRETLCIGTGIGKSYLLVGLPDSRNIILT